MWQSLCRNVIPTDPAPRGKVEGFLLEIKFKIKEKVFYFRLQKPPQPEGNGRRRGWKRKK